MRRRRCGKRGAGLPATVDEDPEIAELLRHLVSGRDEPGDDTDAHVDGERRADRQAAEEVVQGVATRIR